MDATKPDLTVVDLGVGFPPVTPLELYEKLHRVNPSARVFAVDEKRPSLMLETAFHGGRVVVVFDEDLNMTGINAAQPLHWQRILADIEDLALQWRMRVRQLLHEASGAKSYRFGDEAVVVDPLGGYVERFAYLFSTSEALSTRSCPGSRNSTIFGSSRQGTLLNNYRFAQDRGLSKEFFRNISFHQGGFDTDILKALAPEGADVLRTFNVLRHKESGDKNEIAAVLAFGVREGGILLEGSNDVGGRNLEFTVHQRREGRLLPREIRFEARVTEGLDLILPVFLRRDIKEKVLRIGADLGKEMSSLEVDDARRVFMQNFIGRLAGYFGEDMAAFTILNDGGSAYIGLRVASSPVKGKSRDVITAYLQLLAVGGDEEYRKAQEALDEILSLQGKEAVSAAVRELGRYYKGDLPPRLKEWLKENDVASSSPLIFRNAADDDAPAFTARQERLGDQIGLIVKPVVASSPAAFFEEDEVDENARFYILKSYTPEQFEDFRISARMVNGWIEEKKRIGEADILELHRVVSAHIFWYEDRGAPVPIKRGAYRDKVISDLSTWHKYPHPKRISSLMKEFFRWFSREFFLMEAQGRGDANKAVVFAAKVFYRFVNNIHPFEDGNGRTGRLLMNYILKKYGRRPFVLRDANEGEYYAVTRRMKQERDFIDFLASQTKVSSPVGSIEELEKAAAVATGLEALSDACIGLNRALFKLSMGSGDEDIRRSYRKMAEIYALRSGFVEKLLNPTEKRVSGLRGH